MLSTGNERGDQTPLKNQCLLLDLHSLPKAHLLPWAWVQQGQYDSETQSDAQESSSNPEPQLITQSIAIVQSSFIFTLPLWNQLDSSPKPSTRMSHLKLSFRWVFKGWAAIEPLPCDSMPGNPWELSQKAVREWMQNRLSCSASHLPQHGLEHVDSRVVWRWFCPLQIFWINKIVLYIRNLF